jgi:hypothetical protein
MIVSGMARPGSVQVKYCLLSHPGVGQSYVLTERDGGL